VTSNKETNQIFSPSLHIDLLGAATGQRLILPFYHTVGDDDLPHIKHLYLVRNSTLFKNDLNFFLKNYIPVDLSTLTNHVTKKEILYQNSFFLSFDDGLSEIYDVIAPLLLKMGVPATFFINPAFIDNKDLFFRYKVSLLIEALETRSYSEAVLQKAGSLLYPHLSLKEQLLAITYTNKHKLDEVATVLDIDFTDYLKKQQPYLTSEQLHILNGQGFTIGSHSMDHPRYADISLAEQLDQTQRSIEWVKTDLDQSHDVFAFPFTDHQVSKSFFTSVFDSQQPVLDISFGTAGMKRDMISTNLQRIPMEKSMGSAEAIIIKEYLYYMAKSPFGKNTIRRE
jgi:peptidoglycan/xylan/chitin deacetylase (PgdA/CDA1 family)